MKHIPTAPYCPDRFAAGRRLTSEVPVGVGMGGPVVIGGAHPVCVQSMTTSSTRDIVATADQACRLVEAGCDIVRITAPTVKDAHCIGEIKALLEQRGIRVPLVADIHFQPAAAMAAADYVDKIRINPGNFADKKIFDLREYTEQEYLEELERIEERFAPLIEKCRTLGRAMRIGTNHGSLSDRIMGHYGDTPEGMVASAIEFVQLCEKHDYRHIVLSMKASNPQVMIEANRLLVARMTELGMQYPFHLGVTEAGDGEDGRIKSAVGIGSLLEDGIGDTIRVSLTEDPEREIPVARELVALTSVNRVPDSSAAEELREFDVSPYEFDRFPSENTPCGPLRIGGADVPCVQVRVSFDEWAEAGAAMCAEGVTVAGEPLPAADLIAFDLKDDADVARFLVIARDWSAEATACVAHVIPGLSSLSEICALSMQVEVSVDDAWDADALAALCSAMTGSQGCLRWTLSEGTVESGWTGLAYQRWRVLHDACVAEGLSGLSVGVKGSGLISAGRALAARLRRDRILIPIHLISATGGETDVRLSAAVQHGTLLCDGIGDSIEVGRPEGDAAGRQRISFNILQASGRRVVKTEYVACPSCGRTLFDLQDTTERIRSRTAHLKGVKIAIMGCIVNGPGEMADADFGYVGSSAGNVSLYVGKNCVERNIPEAEADGRLIRLIQDHGRWVDPAK